MLKSDTLSVNQKNGLIYITFPNINDEDAVCAFTTRMGGVSRGRYASMNMGFLNGDKRENVLENYRRIFDILGLDHKKAVLSHQTHTDNIRIVTKEDIGKGIVRDRDYTDIDGLITNVKGVALVTQFADCVPLIFYDPVEKIVATSHAGWRGTVAEIGFKTVEKMAKEFGSDPKNIKAAIGPSIGKCCYEVDDAVANPLKEIKYLNLEKVLFSKTNGKFQLDLREANRQILLKAGVKNENICVSDLCTCCHSEYFHSHRATMGNRGNLAAIVALK